MSGGECVKPESYGLVSGGECVIKLDCCGFLSPGERGQPGRGDGPDAAGRDGGSSEGQSGQSAGDAGKDQGIVSASGFCFFRLLFNTLD